MQQNHNIYTLKHDEGYWVDVGTPESLEHVRNLLEGNSLMVQFLVARSRRLHYQVPSIRTQPSFYSFQNVLVKIVKTVMISSLPIIISRLRTILLISGICAKLLIGPTVPSPGPIPAIHVATALEAVTGSTPVITTIIVPMTKRKRYKTTNERIEIFVFSVMLFHLIL